MVDLYNLVTEFREFFIYVSCGVAGAIANAWFTKRFPQNFLGVTEFFVYCVFFAVFGGYASYIVDISIKIRIAIAMFCSFAGHMVIMFILSFLIKKFGIDPDFIIKISGTFNDASTSQDIYSFLGKLLESHRINRFEYAALLMGDTLTLENLRESQKITSKEFFIISNSDLFNSNLH